MTRVSKYDEYGVPKNEPWPDIKEGDVVEYIDSKQIFDPISKKRIKFKEILRGVWDGEKVSFDDREKTVVRTKRWLNRTECVFK